MTMLTARRFWSVVVNKSSAACWRSSIMGTTADTTNNVVSLGSLSAGMMSRQVTSFLRPRRGGCSDRGMTDVRGPANPSLNYDCGLLIDGFDSPPTFLIPYNRDYYGRLIEAFGFEKVQDLFSYEAHIDMLQDLDPKLKFVIEEATKTV